MNIWYKRQSNDSYMVLEGDDFVESYESIMIQQNQIKSILSYYTMEMDGKIQFWSKITGKESLKDYLDSNQMSIETLDKIFMYMYLAMEEVNRYLIDQSHLLLRPDTIYIDKRGTNNKMSFCYCPTNNEPANIQLRSVLEYIINIVDHDEERFTELCYDLYEIAQNDDYSIKQLWDYVAKNKEEDDNINLTSEAYVDQYEADKSRETPEIPVEKIDLLDESIYFTTEKEEKVKKSIWKKTRKHKEKKEKRSIFKKKKPKVLEEIEKMDFEFDPNMTFSEPTVILTPSDRQPFGKLVYDGKDDEESYMIDKETFRIGSGTDCDACLKSRAVSRNHARIIKDGNYYYIEDMNSTNGTYLNGHLLNYNAPVKLGLMDQIMFGNVSYVFM